MKLVRIERTGSGFLLDPSAYLAELARLVPQLPAGAARFADDPQHYDFLAEHCVKDLKLVGVAWREDDGLAVQASFAWRYDADPALVIRYRAVSEFTVRSPEPTRDTQPFRSLADVQLDEILPHSAGCAHEIQFIAGTVSTVCADLEAQWLA